MSRKPQTQSVGSRKRPVAATLPETAGKAPGRQDQDNFTRGLVTVAPSTSTGGADGLPALSGEMVKVRTLRAHDTDGGMRKRGDEYERSAAHAAALIDLGLVELVGTPTDAKTA